MDFTKQTIHNIKKTALLHLKSVNCQFPDTSYTSYTPTFIQSRTLTFIQTLARSDNSHMQQNNYLCTNLHANKIK